jgi:arylsulfatase A-like enzyme
MVQRLFVILFLAAQAQAGNATRPHIFMMLADDWGSYDASYRMRELGREPDILTPSIDALGGDPSNGMRFSNYYVQPICTPTRAGLLTGRYSIHTGSEHILFGAYEDSCLPVGPTAPPLMQEAFKTLQYQTHMIGKWHLGYANDTCAPWSRSFDSYLGYLNGNAGYYCKAKDFHECNVSSSSSAHREYVNVTGKGVGPLATGVAGGARQNLSYTAAVKLCNAAQEGCYGISHPAASAGLLDVTFMKSTAVNSTAAALGGGSWTTHVSKAADPPSCTWDSFSACNFNYEDEYSTHVYTRRAQNLIEQWEPSQPSLFVYLAWQAVHEPMTVPERYLEPYKKTTLDPSRQIYAGMLAALDEGIGNITASLHKAGLYANSVTVLSNDNGGMSGSYGLGCCICGTSCGGLNYPYRGWKDSFWEGGFRGIGFVHSPLLKGSASTPNTYDNLLHVSDWYKTLLGAALSQDSPADRAAAEAALSRTLTLGPIDSVDHWEAMASSGYAHTALAHTALTLYPHTVPTHTILTYTILTYTVLTALLLGRHRRHRVLRSCWLASTQTSKARPSESATSSSWSGTGVQTHGVT